MRYPPFGGENPINAVPRPNKDVPYLYFGPARLEPPRGSRVGTSSYRAPKRLYSGGPLLWGDKPWPKRRPSAEDARVGDVIMGNVELRATCSCGHSKLVSTEELRVRAEPIQMLRSLRFRCQQCRRSVCLGRGVSMHLLNGGNR